MKFAAVENAAWYAWPAIEEQQKPYGILRYAHGYTRRANSLTLFNSSAADYKNLVADCEEFFATRSQPVMIRIPRLPALSGLDRFLQINGYTTEAPSMVMVRHLNDRHTVSLKPQRLDRDSWLDSYCTISGQSTGERHNHQQLIGRIESETFYAALENSQGMPACCALAILYKGVIGIYNVATAASFRRQQYASHLITALLDWGREVGASNAYLQVEESNLPAIKLYRKAGFSRLYRYSYRVKKATDETGRGGG